MAELLQILISGLSSGAIYALAAVGFTLLWQASQTINFAQGEFVMLPAFFVLAGMTLFGLPLWAAILTAFVLSIVILGAMFKKLVVEPMLPHGTMPLVIATIALGLLMKESVKEFYSAQGQPFPSLFPQHVMNFFGASVSVQDLCNLAVAFAAIIALQLFLQRTRTGRAMQATAQDPRVAEILGVDVKRMVMYTFLINGALAAIASILISPVYLAKFSNGETLGMIAFIAAIVGGFNQIRGALVGGLLIGVLDNLAAVYISAEYRTAIPLILLIVIIMVRPQGIMGTSEGRTV
ncbi:MAG: branched-chain amino acid ABC transporter permease [Alphaproteobacteria bacterium]|nr:branched-chain amino acid ABC transporter permease [Alphaproteobacteria bacterium]MBU1281214.1 branched-chain amino acid ABC transporter permease [Alphaproteobacteria bacterium]MBU1575553.1 branched-chain amino acid ABC transporter permease [Alphaproteobacteria bacterium]MBU1827695.1 branched-chain amino acid ABC transporter permease [Alphaproteobacteria bacterium]MBU2077661.1 branched-chain amino acid ABC transporter permease [Alphaproteobacteria bacterium]